MRRTAAEAAETRRQLLDAALLALAERGFEGTTFEHIAARVGLTRGAVHHHFRGGKEELLRVLLFEQWSRYGEQVLAPLREPRRGGGERLRMFLTAYLELICDDPMFRALATVTTLVAPRAASLDAGLAGHRESLEGWRAAVRAVLAEPATMAPGVEIEAAVFTIVNFLIGVNDTAAIEPEQLPATASAREAVARAVLSGLLRDPRAGREIVVDRDVAGAPW